MRIISSHLNYYAKKYLHLEFKLNNLIETIIITLAIFAISFLVAASLVYG